MADRTNKIGTAMRRASLLVKDLEDLGMNAHAGMVLFVFRHLVDVFDAAVDVDEEQIIQ